MEERLIPGSLSHTATGTYWILIWHQLKKNKTKNLQDEGNVAGKNNRDEFKARI